MPRKVKGRECPVSSEQDHGKKEMTQEECINASEKVFNKKTEEKDPIIDKDNMTESEMFSILLDFYGSKFFPAYDKYINMRLSLADNSLRSIDPFKNPTEMARSQGIRSGLLDLTDILITLKQKVKEAEASESQDQ
jgi:hypothetical protein